MKKSSNGPLIAAMLIAATAVLSTGRTPTALVLSSALILVSFSLTLPYWPRLESKVASRLNRIIYRYIDHQQRVRRAGSSDPGEWPNPLSEDEAEDQQRYSSDGPPARRGSLANTQKMIDDIFAAQSIDCLTEHL